MVSRSATQPSETSGSFFIRTLLVTDLVDSTRLVERLGDARAGEIFAQHDRLARDLLAQFGGHEVDKTDGFLLMFERPVDAVLYALTYHEELAEISARWGLELKARAGIHLGEVLLRENSPQDVARGAKPLEVEGLAKPIAARTMALAQGGQTLLTPTAFELSRRAIPGDQVHGRPVRWLHHGEFQFKGLAEPLHIYEVGLEGLSPLALPPDNEKAFRTQTEISVLTLQPPEPLRPWGWVTAALMAVVLGIVVAILWPEGGGSKASSPRQSVAVLPFKQLSGSPEDDWLSTGLAEMLVSHLGVGGSLRLVSGERAAQANREVVPMEAAGPLAPETLSRLRGYLSTDYVVVASYTAEHDAVNLLISLQETQRGETVATMPATGSRGDLFGLVAQAAESLRTALKVTTASASEQSAVRQTVSTNEQASARYAQGLELLRNYDAAAARDLLEQAAELDPTYALAHQALSQAWLILGYDERARASAQKAFDLTQGLPREEELAIQGLYYEIHGNWPEAIRIYNALWSYHPDNLDHGLKLADVQIRNGNADEALTTLGALRQLPAPQGDDPRIDLKEADAARILGNYDLQLQAALEAVRKSQQLQISTLMAQARYQEGWASQRLGKSREAQEALEDARNRFQQLGDRSQVARCLNQLGVVADQNDGNLALAESRYREALKIHTDIGHRAGIAEMLNNLGVLKRQQGELQTATSLLAESLAKAEESGNRPRQGWARENMATVLLRQGRLVEAEAEAQAALELALDLAAQDIVAWASFDLGRIDLVRGRLSEARTHYDTALDTAQKRSYSRLEALVYNDLGQLLLQQDQLAEADEMLEKAARLRRSLNEQSSLAETQLAQALLRLAQNRPADAVNLAATSRDRFQQQGRTDHYALAQVVLARAWRAQGDRAAATSALEPALERARSTENPSVRLLVTITQATLQGDAGDRAAARRSLQQVIAEAEQLMLAEIRDDAQRRLQELAVASGGSPDRRQPAAVLHAGLWLLRQLLPAGTPAAAPAGELPLPAPC